MEDAHPEGDGRAGDSDNRRQRLEAIPAQHHHHPRGGGRLSTQVSQQAEPSECDPASVAIAVSQGQGRCG